MLGNLALTSVVAMAIACTLMVARPASWGVAIWWCALYLSVLALAAGSQIAFLGWGIGVQGAAFAGFSGHASRAAAVLPVAFFLSSARRRVWLQGLLVLIGMLAAALVAASRVAIGAHSLSEAFQATCWGPSWRWPYWRASELGAETFCQFPSQHSAWQRFFRAPSLWSQRSQSRING